MLGDKVCYNGGLTTLDSIGTDKLTGTCHIYQHIHTREHKALWPQRHIDIASDVMYGVHECRPEIDAATLDEHIRSLLSLNRYPKAANLVTLRIFPPEKPEVKPSWLLESTSQLLYSRYTLWHSRSSVVVFPCEYLYMGWQTAISRTIAGHSAAFARRHGADAAIIENCNGVLTNCGDEPLFMAVKQEVFTSPLSEGAVESVMRGLIIEACLRLGIKVTETPLSRNMAEACDEMFYPTPQGITSVKGFGGRLYFNVIAGKIAERLDDL